MTRNCQHRLERVGDFEFCWDCDCVWRVLPGGKREIVRPLTEREIGFTIVRVGEVTNDIRAA
jgi:hypothetical protein